jgi:hypothetical protein
MMGDWWRLGFGGCVRGYHLTYPWPALAEGADLNNDHTEENLDRVVAS